MDLATANRLIEHTLAEARSLDTKPMAVVVLDAGGHLVACAREDGASFGRIDLAKGKAWGSLSLGFGSRTLSERVAGAPGFFTAAASLFGGQLLPAPGGLLVLRDDHILGAMGVSGDTGDKDETCAVAAIASCGLSYRS